MDVLLVLTALTVFVGVRTLALVRSRRASSGRRVIVAAALRPRPAASQPAASQPAASRPAASRPAAARGRTPAPDQGDGRAALPTRRSLRGSRSGDPVTLSTLAAPTGGWHDGTGRDDAGAAAGAGGDPAGDAGDTVGAPSPQLLPPPPRGRSSRRGDRQPSSQRSAA